MRCSELVPDKTPMNPEGRIFKFVIRNAKPSFINYIRYAWGYFFLEGRKDCKVIIRKNDIFIHIGAWYCVIMNDLKHIRNCRKDCQLEATKTDFKWLDSHGVN